MGLDNTSTRFHCWLKKNGANFSKTAMLGRQTFYGLDGSSLVSLATNAGLEIEPDFAKRIFTDNSGYAEPFYNWLGAKSVDSFDYSDYEKATKIWDMNQPADDQDRGLYDFLYDGGTLEHVFNYPAALREAMTLVKPGGIFLSATPANSFLGHGFYQFGPDLPYSILTAENGYECGGVYVVEMRRDPVFFEVLPPSKDRGRALASTPWPALMFFWGRRVGQVPTILKANQPDYENTWEGGEHQERSKSSEHKRLHLLLSGLSEMRRNDLLRLLKLGYVTLRGNAFFDQNCFRRAPYI